MVVIGRVVVTASVEVCLVLTDVVVFMFAIVDELKGLGVLYERREGL